MRIILFGATGMIGHGALLEALDHPRVTEVLAVGRRAPAVQHDKLRTLEHGDFTDFSSVAEQLTGYDACIWCLGIASAGMSEADYTRITVDFTLAAAEVMLERNPAMRWSFVSGAGTSRDARAMWARVKARAEDALLALAPGQVVCFRPAYIRPLRGASSSVALYKVGYTLMRPLEPLLKAMGQKTDTVELGRALLAGVMGLAEGTVIESRELAALAGRLPGG